MSGKRSKIINSLVYEALSPLGEEVLKKNHRKIYRQAKKRYIKGLPIRIGTGAI